MATRSANRNTIPDLRTIGEGLIIDCSLWILATGFWRDVGLWNDYCIWTD